MFYDRMGGITHVDLATMKNLNWKFWTWPRQIRALKRALAEACGEIEKLKAERNRQSVVNRPRTQHL
jgi:hypothetical protein